ncbi:MAG: diacylglycerol kinase family protein [Chitinophagaceae bacterium]
MKKSISPVSRWQSIRFAMNGIRSFFQSEPNAVVHLLSTVLVVLLSFLFTVTATEALVLVMVTGGVWMAELFNTALEKAMDLVSKEKDPSIGFIKDVAAAAVLVSALTALVAGLLIFIPKIRLV